MAVLVDLAVASRARSALLAVCAFAFLLLAWDVIFDLKMMGEIGFESDGAFPIATVTYLAPNLPGIRAGLRVGDKIDFASGSISSRVGALRWITGVPQILAIQRRDRHLFVRVVPMQMTMDASFWLTVALAAWAIVLATIVAFHGLGRRSSLLAWLILLNVGNGVLGGGLLVGGEPGFYSPWPWLTAITILFVSSIVNGLATASLAAIAATFAQPLSSLRYLLTLTAYITAAIAAGVALAQGLKTITPWVNWVPMNATVENALSAVALVCAAASAIAALTSVRRDERQQAAWLLLPLVAAWLFSAGWSVAGPFVGGYFSGWERPYFVASSVTSFILPLALTYAVLRRRLLDVNFFVNRAAVFATVSVVIIGLFVLAEWLLNKIFVDSNHTTSLAVTALVTLILGMSLRFIHTHVDRVVDYVVFRRRHEYERSLRMFAHEVAYIADYEAFLDNVMREVSNNGDMDNVSILTRTTDGYYVTVRGKAVATVSVSADDRAIVKMRAWHHAVDLDEVDTVLDGAWAYPLACRGQLLGILVCGTKCDGQGYAPDESDALWGVAQGVGAALGSFMFQSDDKKDDAKADVNEIKEMMYKIYGALQAERLRQFDNGSGEASAAGTGEERGQHSVKGA